MTTYSKNTRAIVRLCATSANISASKPHANLTLKSETSQAACLHNYPCLVKRSPKLCFQQRARYLKSAAASGECR